MMQSATKLCCIAVCMFICGLVPTFGVIPEPSAIQADVGDFTYEEYVIFMSFLTQGPPPSDPNIAIIFQAMAQSQSTMTPEEQAIFDQYIQQMFGWHN